MSDYGQWVIISRQHTTLGKNSEKLLARKQNWKSVNYVDERAKKALDLKAIRNAQKKFLEYQEARKKNDEEIKLQEYIIGKLYIAYWVAVIGVLAGF
jgi:hypothetical protein